jgi:hypothetical protein
MAASGIRVKVGRSYAKLETAARYARSVLAPGLAATDPLPGVDLLERLEEFVVPVNGKPIPLTYGVETLAPGIEALTRYQVEDGNIIVTLSEETYANLEAGKPRARFCTCHEIGHAVLHAAELVELSQIPHRDMGLYRATQGTHDPYVDSEWQANAFAAALLMPADALAEFEKTCGSGWEIDAAEKLQASFEAMSIRARVFAQRRAQLLMK